MTNHKATPEQWKKVEESAAPSAVVTGGSTDSCILKLRARGEALEAHGNHIGNSNKMVPPPMATDEDLRAIWYSAYDLGQALRAIYDLGVAHGQACSREVAEPAPVAGALVKRVRLAIDSVSLDEESRAAILEVVRWLRERHWVDAPDALEQEAGR